MLDVVFRSLALTGIPEEDLFQIKQHAREALHRLPERFLGNPGWRAFLDFRPGELMGLADLVSKYGNSDLVSDQAAAFIGEASSIVKQENMVRVAHIGLHNHSEIPRG